MITYSARIRITLKKGILDVQGKAVKNALHAIEYPMIDNVRIGKYVELTVEAETEKEAGRLVDEAAQKLIANPIIEDYVIEITNEKE